MPARERPSLIARALGGHADGPWVSLAIVAALLAISWAVSYVAGGAKVAPHLFYVPILLAAARLGPAGTALTALAAGLLAGPMIPLDTRTGADQPLSDWLIRSAYFVGIGMFTWLLFERLWHTKRALQEWRRVGREHRDERILLMRRLDEERQRLLSRVVRAQEEERRRIAHDLHDDSIQVMTALRLRLGMLRSKVQDPEALRQLSRLEETAQETIQRLRRLMFDLYPSDLDRRGLSETLRRSLDAMLRAQGIAHDLQEEMEVEPPTEVRTAAYRIVREALTNIVKHARATRVDVELRGDARALTIRITDNGVGFTHADTEAGPGHLGLVAMRERAEVLGGSCTIRSAPGRGTKVELRLPVTGPGLVGRSA